MKKVTSLLMLLIFTLSLAMPAYAATSSASSQRQKPSMSQDMTQPGGRSGDGRQRVQRPVEQPGQRGYHYSGPG